MPADLSEYHRPITSWPEMERPLALSDEEVARYWRDGFLVGVPVLGEHDLARINNEIDEIADPDHNGRQYWYEYSSNLTETGGLIRGIGGWRVRESLHDLLWHPVIVSAFTQLLGGPGRLLFDQLFCKAARRSGAVSWHQDYSYWTYTQPMNHVTCWIALEAADLSNGCVQYVPGSHRWGLLPRPSGLTRDQDSLLTVLTDEQRAAFRPVPAEVPAGSVLFHHPLTVHGSLPNTSARSRRGTTIHVMCDGTRAAVDEPDEPTVGAVPVWLLGGAGPFYPVTGNPAGPVLAGQFFPLLSARMAA